MRAAGAATRALIIKIPATALAMHGIHIERHSAKLDVGRRVYFILECRYGQSAASYGLYFTSTYCYCYIAYASPARNTPLRNRIASPSTSGGMHRTA